MAEKKKISLGVSLGIIAAVAAVCAGAGYLHIQNLRQTYAEAEAAMPESAISRYLQQIQSGDLDGIYEDSMIVEPHLNGKEEYIAALEEIYAGVDIADITYVKSEESTEDNLLYQLVTDNTLLATVHLIKDSDGQWLASTIFSGDNDYTIEVPTGLTLTINGNAIDDTYCTEAGVTASNFEGLTDQSEAPIVNVYQINNLLAEPEIGIEGQSGYTTLKDVVSGTLYVGKSSTDTDLADTMLYDIETAARFPAQEVSLGAVAAVMVTGSDCYSRISTLQNTWFTSHSTSYFSNEKAYNIIQQSDNTAVGYVTYDYYASNGSVDRTWHAGFQVSLIESGGTWKIAGLGTDSTLNENQTIPEY